MAASAVVVPPGAGVRTGNVEFLALSEHSPRFNVSLITMAPLAEGPEAHAHPDEDTRVPNIHAPAGFDRRLLGGE